MNKYDFVQYSAARYGIDESFAETIIDMFTDSLQELISAGQSVDIDGLGEFQTTPLFPNGLNYQDKNNTAKDRKNTGHKNIRKNMVSFKPSQDLTENSILHAKI